MKNFINQLMTGSLTLVLMFNPLALSSPLGIHKFDDGNKDKIEGITTPLIEYPVSAQYAAQFFEGGQIPEALLNFRSQQYLLKQYQEEIIKRTQADEGKPLVTVAVLDIGVDLENKVLRDRVKFDIKDGKITGAGFDFMSMTPWGTHQLLDPWIYAIGSEGINESGQIRLANTQAANDATTSPIKHLLSINDSLVNEVLAKINSSPTLQQSLFSKLNLKNVNILGLLKLAQLPLSAEEYSANEKAGMVFKLNTQVTETTPALIKNFIMNPKQTWIMNPNTGVPDGLELLADNFSNLAGANEFKSILQETFSTPENLSPLKKEISNLYKFFSYHHFPIGAAASEINNYTYSKISNLIALKKLGSQVESSVFDFFMLARKIKYQYPDLSWNELLENSFKLYEVILQGYHLQNKALGEYKEIKTTNDYLNDLNILKNYIYELNKEHRLDVAFEQFMTTGSLPWIKGYSSAQRKMLVRGINPLLHPDSQYADHGSHVSGTMLAYFDKFRIFPIRVSLGMVKGNAPIQSEYVGKNIAALNEWLQIPIVSRSIMNTLKQDAKINANFLNYNLSNEAGRKSFAEYLMKNYFQEYIKMETSRSGIVSQSLLWEIRDSVRMLADRKIPFANLSLGGEIEQPEYDRFQNQDEEKIKATLDFIFAEFQKYKIAEAISTEGKNTLFMMAAGNSKNYADNESRSNYPAGLTSPWLDKNRKQGETLPTDGMKNVTIVMSLNEKNSLSNFTNLILTGENVIAIRGEDIMSQTTSHSMWGARKTFKRILPEVRLMDFNPNDNRFVRFSRGSNMPESLVQFSIKIAKSYVQVSRMFLFHKYNDKMDLKDGTSMATPTLIALASEIFSKRLERLGKRMGRLIKESDIYGTEGFRPEDIMETITKNASQEKYGSVVVIKKIKNAKNQKPTPQEEQFTDKLLNIRSSAFLCLKYYYNK